MTSFIAKPSELFDRFDPKSVAFKRRAASFRYPAVKDDGIMYKSNPIMRFRGEAQPIDRRLIEKIKACDIFIADITVNLAG